jgi:hypothetical protein
MKNKPFWLWLVLVLGLASAFAWAMFSMGCEATTPAWQEAWHNAISWPGVNEYENRKTVATITEAHKACIANKPGACAMYSGLVAGCMDQNMIDTKRCEGPIQ